MTDKLIDDDIKQMFFNRYYIALLLILAAATFFRFKMAFFQGLWVDEGRFAGFALEMAKHPLSYSTYWTGEITQHPPFFTYLLATSVAIFGQSDFAVRIVSPLMGVLGVLLSYYLGREMFNREVGLATAALLAFSPTYFFLSERILIGVTFAVVYTSAIFLLYYGLEDRPYSKYALWLLGPAVAINIMTKQPAYSLGLVIPVYFLYRKWDKIHEVLFTDTKLLDSDLMNELKNRNYYVSAGLGLLTILPWMVRNQAICGVPLCGLSRALRFAGRSSAAWESTGGTFYYFSILPSVLTFGVAALLAFRVVKLLFDQYSADQDMMIKKGAAALALVGLTYFGFNPATPLAIIASIALFARSDAEKLLWLTVGVGIGFMSMPAVKVPRYIIFVVPSMVAISALTLYDISGKLSALFNGLTDNESLERYNVFSAQKILIVLMMPLVLLSAGQAFQTYNAATSSFNLLEPAGKWLDSEMDANDSLVASSPTQLRYYIYPRESSRFPEKAEDFRGFLLNNSIDYVEVDIYEKAQPRWAQTGLPPYRLPFSTIRALNSRQVSPQQVVQSYGAAPDYLVPVKEFGQTQIPLLRQNQPVVRIYRVNRTALE